MAIIKQDVKLYILEWFGDRSLSMYDFSENDSLYSCLGSVTVPVEYDEDDLIDPAAAKLAAAEAQLEAHRAESHAKEKILVDRVNSIKALPHLGGDA